MKDNPEMQFYYWCEECDHIVPENALELKSAKICPICKGNMVDASTVYPHLVDKFWKKLREIRGLLV